MSIREPTPIEPYEVVSIGGGERFTPPYMEVADWWGTQAVLEYGLKKDRTPKMITGSARFNVAPEPNEPLTTNHQREIWRYGYTQVNFRTLARYIPEREEKAQAIREEIKTLELELAAKKEALLDLYRVHGEKDANFP